MDYSQFRLVVLLACVAVIRAASTGITVDGELEMNTAGTINHPICLSSIPSAPTNASTNVTVALLQTKRYSLIAEKQYTFYIPIASAAQKELAAVVFQIHAQRHTIVLSQDPVPQYGRYANGSHVGLYQDLLMNSTTLQFYATAACLGQCSEQPETVQVMIAATVVKSMSEWTYTLYYHIIMGPSSLSSYSIYINIFFMWTMDNVVVSCKFIARVHSSIDF